MARKGILVTDPSVRKMTRAQWIFEYLALRERESEERKFHVDSLRRILIYVMGLSAVIPGNEDPDKFVPLIVLAGNHHLMHGYAKSMGVDMTPDEDGTTSISDQDWEKMSQRMAAGMEPIEDNPFDDISARELLDREDKKILGVQEVDELPSPNAEILDLGALRAQTKKD